jgi:hypothetical protein
LTGIDLRAFTNINFIFVLSVENRLIKKNIGKNIVIGYDIMLLMLMRK